MSFQHDKPSCFDTANWAQFEMATQRKVLVGTQLGCVYMIDDFTKSGDLKAESGDGSGANFEIINCFNQNANFCVSSLKIMKPATRERFFFGLATMDGFVKVFSSRHTMPLFEVQFYSKPLRNLWADPSRLLLFFIDEIEKDGLCALHLFGDSGQSGETRRELCRKVDLPENAQNRRVCGFFRGGRGERLDRFGASRLLRQNCVVTCTLH